MERDTESSKDQSHFSLEESFEKTDRSGRLFEQVYDYVVDRIKRREWAEHDRLPSIRQLANELQVHRLTVFKAYQLLKKDQLIYVKDKSGYYVHPASALPPQSIQKQSLEHHTRTHFSISIQKNHLAEVHSIPVTYQFSQALIDPNLLPNYYFSMHVKKVFDLYPKVLGTYAPVQGDEELRATLAAYFSLQHRFHLSSDELMITSGAQQALALVAKVFLKPRDVVMMECPTYSAAIDFFRQQGAQIISVDIHPNGFDLEQVEKVMRQAKPRLFYVNPTFHNPTGYTVPARQRKRLVELAEQYHCMLVEDDAFHDIYFDQEPPQPLFTYDTEGVVLYIRSFSKYVAPGLRIAALASRQSLMSNLLIAKSFIDNGTPLLNQKIFSHYFLSPRFQKHLAKLRIALEIRKEIMESELKGSGWRWTTPTGGLNLWLELPEHVHTNTLLAKSIDKSVSFVPGSICDPEQAMQRWLRLSYSYMNEQQIRIGMKRLLEQFYSLTDS
ncbi:GntR family transcriptional regulator [Brevibacillus sp. SKDU10]|uniref:aminotransferase-like domain-containing protein n=1 Tax=Brevibacillus sp. SKDU10 TaxID=1247872 RepID=UPI0007C88F46|nr:PLP-dependent aminotransferase family protein [Brevibacillus sp. SKDU10]OAJ74465.1 GntR family transcriptional regulator [Brevibacillus sp. SKDU10]